MRPDDPRLAVPEEPTRSLKVFKSLERFLRIEAASGVLLLVATALALVWANSPWSAAYKSLWDLPLRFGVAMFHWETTPHLFVNEGLMTIFFLLAGLEIRRELHDGALSSARAAVVPIAAALGGVLVPALIYLVLTRRADLQQGWAIPTATDIAFAIGVLGVLGRRVPPAVRVLLLALAIIDDIAAIAVIAIFYSSGIGLTGMVIALFGILGVFGLQYLGIRPALAYVPMGAIVWVGLLRAGVHPTLAGVILGLLTPTRGTSMLERYLDVATRARESLSWLFDGACAPELARMRRVQHLLHGGCKRLSPVVRVERALHPWVAYVIMPVFAFANAGVRFEGLAPGARTTSLALGIVLALVLGKPFGIITFTALVTKSGCGSLPPEINWRGVVLVGCLGGVGFTMSLLIATLAFDDAILLSTAKWAVLLASGIAGVGGLLIGRVILYRRPYSETTHRATESARV